jgi:outer membrane immunogenic protein
MAMRSILLAAALLFGGTSLAVAQESYSGDAAATYHWVHTNAGPGQCGCFGLNGAGLSGSWNVDGPWSVVVDASSEFTNNASSTGNSLTLTSFLGGARFQLPEPWLRGIRRHRPQPFAQVLVGVAHAGGGEAGVGDASNRFAARVGGGIDVPLGSRFALRAIQIDYFPTTFANATNDHQNNLMISVGIVYHWSHQK